MDQIHKGELVVLRSVQGEGKSYIALADYVGNLEAFFETGIGFGYICGIIEIVGTVYIQTEFCGAVCSGCYRIIDLEADLAVVSGLGEIVEGAVRPLPLGIVQGTAVDTYGGDRFVNGGEAEDTAANGACRGIGLVIPVGFLVEIYSTVNKTVIPLLCNGIVIKIEHQVRIGFALVIGGCQIGGGSRL